MEETFRRLEGALRRLPASEHTPELLLLAASQREYQAAVQLVGQADAARLGKVPPLSQDDVVAKVLPLPAGYGRAAAGPAGAASARRAAAAQSGGAQHCQGGCAGGLPWMALHGQAAHCCHAVLWRRGSMASFRSKAPSWLLAVRTTGSLPTDCDALCVLNPSHLASVPLSCRGPWPSILPP